MTTTRNIPPSDLNPEGDICIPLTVPNDWEWLWLVHKALTLPSAERFWADDLSGSNLIMRDNWEARVAMPFANNILDGVLCSGDDTGSLGECFRMDTTTEVFSFYPNDPFLDPNNNEGNKIASALKWTRWADAGINGLPYAGDLIETVLGAVTGYFPNDIMLTLDLLSPFDNPLERLGDIVTGFTSFWFPTVLVEVEGEGQLEVELINVPFGGSVLLIPDLDISLSALGDLIIDYIDNDGTIPPAWIFTEVNRDLASAPPELVATQVQEFEFTGDERHTVHCVFIPRVDIEAPFYFPFGGIREIEACGTLKIIGAQTGEIIDQNNYRLEQHSREGFIMSTVNDICEGVVCALEKVSSRILLASDGTNVKSGIEVGSIGDITIKPSTGVDISPDITATNPEILNGATFKVAQEVNNFVLQIAEWESLGKTQAYVNSRLPLLYDIADPSVAVANFYASIGANAIVTDNDNLSAYLYCEGINKQAIAIHAIDHFSANETVEELYLELIDLLTQDQLNEWSNEGQSAPRTEYFSYPCHPKDTYKFKWIPSYAGTQRQFSISQYDPSSARLVRIEASGVVVGAGGELLDMKSWVSSGGTVTLANWQFETFPTARVLKVPVDIGYKETHEYNYTVEIPAGNYPSVLWQLDSIPFSLTGATGEIDVNLIDLGEA